VIDVARQAPVIRLAEEGDLDRIAAIERACFSDPWTRESRAGGPAGAAQPGRGGAPAPGGGGGG
jgi:hypothetical protein